MIDDGFLKRIRAAQFSNNVTRIVLDVSSVSDYSAFLLPNPWRLIIDIHGLKPGTTQTTNLASRSAPTTQPPAPATSRRATASSPRSAQPAAIASAAAAAAIPATQEIAALGQQPDRVQATDHPTTRPIAASVAGTVPAPQPDDGSCLDLRPTPPHHQSAEAKPKKEAQPSPPVAFARHRWTATTTLARPRTRPIPPPPESAPWCAPSASRSAASSSIAGHGGHDSGTTGPGGIEEKQVVLDVALRLGKLLKQRLGADVIFTRDNDTFIPLETRTAIANKAQADLFLSIHANSSPDSIRTRSRDLLPQLHHLARRAGSSRA